MDYAFSFFYSIFNPNKTRFVKQIL